MCHQLLFLLEYKSYHSGHQVVRPHYLTNKKPTKQNNEIFSLCHNLSYTCVFTFLFKLCGDQLLFLSLSLSHSLFAMCLFVCLFVCLIISLFSYNCVFLPQCPLVNMKFAEIQWTSESVVNPFKLSRKLKTKYNSKTNRQFMLTHQHLHI